MLRWPQIFFRFVLAHLVIATSLGAQTTLFSDDAPLDLTLRGDIKTILNDRTKDGPYRPVVLTYTNENSQLVSIPLKVKTRGNFRRQKSNCRYPPLRLNFSKSKTPDNSLFAGQDKLKLVTPCQGEKYVIREFLVYQLYNILTDDSFKARLIRVKYQDDKEDEMPEPLYGIILEDEDLMAERLQGKIVKVNGLRPNKVEKEAFHRMAVFEYLIGNTDWSVQYRHNVKLVFKGSQIRPVSVPYDFDHAGIVGAPYAKPAEALQISSIRQRLYRGYCLESIEELETVFNFFEQKREEIYAMYEQSDYLDQKYRKFVRKFLDEFFETLRDPKKRERAFLYPCDPNGTGNIVIRGLRTIKSKR